MLNMGNLLYRGSTWQIRFFPFIHRVVNHIIIFQPQSIVDYAHKHTPAAPTNIEITVDGAEEGMSNSFIRTADKFAQCFDD